MTNIIIPNSATFNFDKLKLLPPCAVQGSAYFTKLEYNNKPLYIQTRKSLTKQGISKSGKRYFSDIMLDSTHEDIITWFEDFENKCYDLMYEKKDRWFQDDLTKEDIANTFAPILRVYKSGKYYLIRANIKTTSTNDLEIKIYDENENKLGVDEITNNSQIMTILELRGIKFSQNKFQLEINLKQIMTIKDELEFSNCLISRNSPASVKKEVEHAVDRYSEHDNETNQYVDPTFDEDENTYSLVKNDNHDLINQIPSITHSTNNKNLTECNLDCDTLEDNTENNILECGFDKKLTPIEGIVDAKLEDTIEDNIESEVFSNKPLEEDELVEFDPTCNDNENENENLSIDFANSDNTFKIKNPNEVYYEMYKKARMEGKEAKKKAQLAYLEAKQIKDLHLLNISDSDSDSDTDINELS